MCDLLGMHVTRADWANNRLATACPHREHDEDVPAAFVPSDGPQPFFGLRMILVQQNQNRARETGFDGGQHQAMFLAFGAVSMIPFKARDFSQRTRHIYECIYKRKTFFLAGGGSFGAISLFDWAHFLRICF
jgi:hypothetical protein